MAAAIDLTKCGETIEFYGSTDDDINYAKTFWQSVQLDPPVESRLVSSDIKQRLKVAPSAAYSTAFPHGIPEEKSDLKDFFLRARTLEHLDKFKRIQKFAQAREEDRVMLEKRQEERHAKEAVFKNKGIKTRRPHPREAFVSNEDEGILEENPSDVLQALDKFEREKFGDDDADSD